MPRHTTTTEDAAFGHDFDKAAEAGNALREAVDRLDNMVSERDSEIELLKSQVNDLTEERDTLMGQVEEILAEAAASR